MATVSTNQYSSLQPRAHSLAGVAHAAFGKYTYSTAPSANDLANMFKLPKNSLVVWGFMATDDIDTGTEALEIDVGFTANGGGAATLTTSDGTTWTNNNDGSASATAFVDSGVLTGDAITDLIPAGMNWRPLNGISTGPMFFSEETVVQAKITAAANAGGTGTVYVCMFYLVI
jgi:hypothetical protein